MGKASPSPTPREFSAPREAWHSAGRNTGAPSLSGSQPGQDAKGSCQSCRKKLVDGLKPAFPSQLSSEAFYVQTTPGRITGPPEVGQTLPTPPSVTPGASLVAQLVQNRPARRET